MLNQNLMFCNAKALPLPDATAKGSKHQKRKNVSYGCPKLAVPLLSGILLTLQLFDAAVWWVECAMLIS